MQRTGHLSERRIKCGGGKPSAGGAVTPGQDEAE